MSGALDAVRAIAAGRRPANFALLQNTRFEGFGTRAFGREPVLDLFHRVPNMISQTTEVLETARGLVAIGSETAVFADLHEDRIVRLWALGETRITPPEPAVSVARDLDLSQTEGDLFFGPDDHPDLRSKDAATLVEIARSFACPAWEPRRLAFPDVFSCRIFVTRAFSAPNGVAALLVLAGAFDGKSRKPFTINAALTFARNDGRLGEAKLVIDRAGLAYCDEAEWKPRI